MAPIKVGFIGLGATSGWARGAHLPYLQKSGKYEIVALLNSSVESSKLAIKQYGLPESTKAYGDPEGQSRCPSIPNSRDLPHTDMAKDPNVDLVVCSVRVDRHLYTIGPSLNVGKNVFVEWPLGKSAAEARQLLKLKNEGGVKIAVVGLQARQAPIIKKVASLISSGKIGKVLSSTWAGQAGNGGPTTTEGTKYIGDKEVGGNLVTIHFGHAVDYVQAVLGYGFVEPKGLLERRRTHVKLVDGEGKVLKDGVEKTADDTIFVTGKLKNGIPVSMTLRGGKPFKGTPGLDWRIYGEKGEIRVTASGPFLQIGYPDMNIQVHDFESDRLEEVEIPRDDLDEGEGKDAFGGLAAKNVGRLYRGLAMGEVNCSFEDAVERHEFLEELYKQNGYLEG